MKYNRLGNTGLFVSELALGTMTFGGTGVMAQVGDVQQTEADRLLARAIESGVNLIDTANFYSDGLSERITGQAIKNIGVDRNDLVVATKVFLPMGAGPNRKGLSRSHLIEQTHASLERLQLDHIDLYQLHGFDPATPVEETLSALNDLLRQGLIRYVGVSNWAAWQIAKAAGIAARRGFEPLASVQALYTLVNRDVEHEIIPMAHSENLGLLVWSPLAGGMLSGKYTREGERGGRRDTLDFPPVNREQVYDVVDLLKPMAQQRGASVAQLALAWLLHQRQVASVLIGAKRIDQLEDNLGATNIVLTDKELSALDAATKPALIYPGWMENSLSGDRLQQLQDSK